MQATCLNRLSRSWWRWICSLSGKVVSIWLYFREWLINVMFHEHVRRNKTPHQAYNKEKFTDIVSTYTLMSFWRSVVDNFVLKFWRTGNLISKNFHDSRSRSFSWGCGLNVVTACHDLRVYTFTRIHFPLVFSFMWQIIFIVWISDWSVIVMKCLWIRFEHVLNVKTKRGLLWCSKLTF